jgi:hypothetical protein
MRTGFCRRADPVSWQPEPDWAQAGLTVQRVLAEPRVAAAPMQRWRGWAGQRLRDALQRGRKAAEMQRSDAGVPTVRDARHRSVESSGEQALRVVGEAGAVARLHKWLTPAWLRLTALTIRQEAPMATPYTCRSASLNTRTEGVSILAHYSCLQLGSNCRSVYCEWNVNRLHDKMCRTPRFTGAYQDFL